MSTESGGQQNGTPSGVTADLAQLEEIAKSVQRVDGDDQVDGDGIRAIRHRGGKQAEMLSWENGERQIIRQQLAVNGMVVSYANREGISTGSIPAGEGLSRERKSRDPRISIDATPAPATLECAAYVLKHIPNRDFYAQTLFKRVAEIIDHLDHDAGRTAVSQPQAFSRHRSSSPTVAVNPEDLIEPTQIVRSPAQGGARLLIYAFVLALIGIGAGIAVGYFLGFI